MAGDVLGGEGAASSGPRTGGRAKAEFLAARHKHRATTLRRHERGAAADPRGRIDGSPSLLQSRWIRRRSRLLVETSSGSGPGPRVAVGKRDTARSVGGSESGRWPDLDLPAVPASCLWARLAVREALASVPVDIAAVGLAVTEAVTNVVVHAYRDRGPADEPGRVRVAVTVHDDAASVVVADEGVGMVPRADSPGLGLGLSLIAGLCDGLEIEQRHDGTRIHMRFGFDADARDAGTEGVSAGG